MSRTILFIGDSTGGGVATINNEVIKVAMGAGHRCLRLDTDRFKSHLPMVLAYPLAYLWTVIIILFHRPSVVYLQLAQTGYLHQSLFLLWAKLMRRETIAHFHAKADLQGACTPRQFRQILDSERYIDKMILLTEPCRKSLRDNGWTGTTFVVPNFINAEGLSRTVPPVSERDDILFIGRMDHEKGIFDILEVARRLPERTFVMVGNFADRAQEEDFRTRLAGLPNVDWVGPVYDDRKYAFFSRSKFLLFPTYRDEFPMTLIESTILGCIPLVSPVGSVGVIIRDGFNGVFIRPGDVEGIVAKIRELLGRDDLEEMSANGVRFARANFTSDSVRDRLLKIVG
ncbi:MAG: glycosyltransferase family 4 protein [bacterium]